MTHTFSRSKITATLIAAFLAAASAIGVASPALADALPSTCGTQIQPGSETDATTNVCVVTTRNLSLDSGDKVAVSANLKVDDSANAGTTVNQRAFLNAMVLCYNTTNGGLTQVFGINSARNIWTGIGLTGVYPRAVFVAPSAGSYTCVLEARQYSVAGNSRAWTIASSALSLTKASFGGSTSGPNLDGWPATMTNITSADSPGTDGFLLANQKSFSPAVGTKTMTITASVGMSTCAYISPDANACTPPGKTTASLDATTPFTTTVRVFASQRTSPTDSSFCGTPVTDDFPTTIDERTHHFTVTATDTLTLSTACTGSVIVKTELHNITGRGYIGNPSPDGTTPGKAFNNDLGATWN